MKFNFYVNEKCGTMTVLREHGDCRAVGSGYTKKTHGWGAEINLLNLIRFQLNKAGFNLVNASVSKDGHLFGDNHMRYLRTPSKILRKNNDLPTDKNNKRIPPYLYIIDKEYAVRSSAEDYNNYKAVVFSVDGNPFDEFDQKDWNRKVDFICEVNKIPCIVMRKIADYGDLIPLKEFINSVENGGFVDYDGHGYFSTASQQSNIYVSPSDIRKTEIPVWATHVSWFNR